MTGRLAAAVLAAAFAGVAPAAPEADMLQRLGVLSADPAVQEKLASARARMADLAWMAGDWDFTVAYPGAPAANRAARRSAAWMPESWRRMPRPISPTMPSPANGSAQP